MLKSRDTYEYTFFFKGSLYMKQVLSLLSRKETKAKSTLFSNHFFPSINFIWYNTSSDSNKHRARTPLSFILQVPPEANGYFEVHTISF